MSEPDDRLRELLRASGRRPSVPADCAERVRRAAREQWTQVVRRRTRRRRLWAAALLATAATLVVGAGVLVRRPSDANTAGLPVVGQIEARVGPAWVRPAATTSAPIAGLPHPGADVARGSEIATDDGGRIAIRLAGGHSLRIDEGTRLRIDGERTIALERGALYVDSWSPGGATPGSIEIRTAFGSLRDVGTQFEARLVGDSLVVRVREGRVSWDRGNATLEIAGGQVAQARASGSVELRNTPADEAAWDWISVVVPMLDIEDRTLGEFLQWIARERGLRVEFASPSLAESAPAIRLRGSIDGMTLEQALASVLATCRVDYRVHDGVLGVHPRDPGRS
jgi:ferric-dicitrate binding protein FerR (iron transport regulator)